MEKDPWLKEDGVFLDYSGQADEIDNQKTIYERYWYGCIKTVADKYLGLIEAIEKSENFNLLSYKTFYALKSKFYLKKAQDKVKEHIASIK